MSFGDFEERDARGRRNFHVNPPPAPLLPRDASTSTAGGDAADAARRIWDRASNTIFLISNNVASIQKLVGLLGTVKDSHDTRTRLHTLTEETRDMIKQTSLDLKQLNASADQSSQFEERQSKLARQKLQKDFEDVLKRFQTVSKLAAEKSREFVHKARVLQQQQDHNNIHDDDDEDELTETHPLMSNNNNKNSTASQQQQQQIHQLRILDNEIEHNEAIIQEREEDLRQIERSIVEVNEIFRDLGTLVNEQQFMLDHIESNVGEVAINMENATGELRTAARYQRMSQNKLCCLFVVLGAIGVVVVLVVLS